MTPAETIPRKIAAGLNGCLLFVHNQNLGYGGCQKSCYRIALEVGADIIIMVHADYQYSPALIPVMAFLIGEGGYACVLGSRILGGQALQGGMPRWKFIANRVLTCVQNGFTGANLSEYHTGYRAFSRDILLRLPIAQNSNDFLFDNQMLAQVLWENDRVAEVSCPAR